MMILALAGFGFLGVPQSGHAETRLLTLGSDASSTVDSLFLARRGPPEGNDFVAPQTPSSANSLALSISGPNGDPGAVSQVNQTDPGNGAIEASRVAGPPQSRLRSFLSAFIQFGAAAATKR